MVIALESSEVAVTKYEIDVFHFCSNYIMIVHKLTRYSKMGCYSLNIHHQILHVHRFQIIGLIDIQTDIMWNFILTCYNFSKTF